MATVSLPQSPAVAAIVLAAGRGSRMSVTCKPLLVLDGQPMVVAVVEAAVASRATQMIVVAGHEASQVREELKKMPVRIVDNPDYRLGLSTSIRAGLAALPPTIDAAVFLLADMPLIRHDHIDRLIGAFAEGTADICLPVHRGRRGNPVLWSRALFEKLAALEGDTGGRALLENHADRVRLVEMDAAVLVDVDEPADLQRLASQPPQGGSPPA